MVPYVNECSRNAFSKNYLLSDMMPYIMKNGVIEEIDRYGLK